MPRFEPDQATTMTAIALAESGGQTDNVPYVFIRLESDPPQAPPSGEDSRGLWQINIHEAPPKADGAHVAISLGDNSTIEVLGSAPPVFDFLL